ncbi:alpha/beta hydrolase [Microbacterium terricola]|uniref:Esterase n=1 Tax=Microbacterium terricola TaxID=344163 RepID=A0ABM8DVI3_9MICO|nr:alpha/beta hydrolase-fold protein [Microbacterium terricola]UYK39609.1 alpha/beta hydrolase-fold protein [Microbacterium terricola]BDV29651.1 esterase [Microbacterium terricola]
MTDVPALDPDAVLWSEPLDARRDAPLLVLLHGYGSHEHDLGGLIPHLPDAFAFAAVRAPLAPRWPTPGYAWYAIENLDAHDPDLVSSAASRFVEWVDAVAPGRTIGLLGFSQGAVVALQALRLRPERFAFVVNLAGYATPGELAGDEQLAVLRPPVFWGRGSRDEVIPAQLVVHTTHWLPAHSELSGRVYPELAHSVSEQELADVRTFLEKQLAALGQ